jgi:hypothetical protein
MMPAAAGCSGSENANVYGAGPAACDPALVTGKPRRRQPSRPPARGRTRVIPRLLSLSATRALVASFGQVQ